MDEEGAFITTGLRKLEKYIRTLPAMRRVRELGRDERTSLLDMEDALAEARKLAHDASTVDTPTIKVSSYQRSLEALEAFRQALLQASQYDLVDAADVAQLSAMAEQSADLARKQVVYLS